MSSTIFRHVYEVATAKRGNRRGLSWQSIAFKLPRMTRREKEQRIQKEDGKAFETYGVEINKTYLNPNYTLSYEAASEISPTGLLKVFKLNPQGGAGRYL